MKNFVYHLFIVLLAICCMYSFDVWKQRQQGTYDYEVKKGDTFRNKDSLHIKAKIRKVLIGSDSIVYVEFVIPVTMPNIPVYEIQPLKGFKKRYRKIEFIKVKQKE